MRQHINLLFLFSVFTVTGFVHASINDAIKKLGSNIQYAEVDAGWTKEDREVATALSFQIKDSFRVVSYDCDDMSKKLQDALLQHGNLPKQTMIIADLAKKSCHNLTKGFDTYTVSIVAEAPDFNSNTVLTTPHIDFYTGNDTVMTRIYNFMRPYYRSFHGVIGEGTEYAENHTYEQQHKFVKTYENPVFQKKSRYFYPESFVYPYIIWKQLLPGDAVIGRIGCANGLIHKRPAITTKPRMIQLIDYNLHN